MTELPSVPLVGRHVRLEPLAPEHIGGLVAAAAESRDTYGLTQVPRQDDEMIAYVSTALAGGFVPFATMTADGRVVGCTRFCNFERWSWPADHEDRRTLDAVEIGWTWLAASAQRTAINTEAKLLMLGHAFEAWRVRRVTLKTDARNARSRAAIERLGGKLDGLLRAHMAASDGTERTSAVYSILADEWRVVRAGLVARLDSQRSAP